LPKNRLKIPKLNLLLHKDCYIRQNLVCLMLKAVTIVALLVFILFAADSCKKTTENDLVNGLWKLNYVNLDTSSANYLVTRFPNYGGTCCVYKLSFQDPNVLITYYFSNDSVKYVAVGTWTVPSYNQLTMKVDSFIDGTFAITRPTLHHWDLTTNYNHVAAFDNGANPQFDTSYAKLDMTRI